MRLALVTLWLVIGLGPEAMPERCCCPCSARWAEALGTLEAPVPPGLLATPFRDWGHTGVFLPGIGCGVACTLCTKGDEEAGGKDRPRPRQGVKPGAGRMALGVLGASCSAVCAHPQGDTEWGAAGWHQEGMGRDHAGSGGQGCGPLEGLEACGAEVGGAPVVVTEEGRKGGAACEWRRCARGPAAQAVAQERRSFRVKPLQDLWEVVCERTGKAMGETDCVADEATTRRNKGRQGAHGGAVGGERGERVAVGEAERDLECGIGGGVCGTAGGKRCTICGQREWVDRQEPAEIILAQSGNPGPLRALKTYGHGVAVEPRMQGLAPPIERFRTVLEAPTLSSLRAGGLEADIVCGIRPVEPNARGTCLWRYRLHVSSPRVCESGAKGHACGRSAKALERAGSAACSAYAWTNASAPAEARLCAKASRASACILVIRGCMCLLSLTATCQVWTVSLQAGHSTYNSLQATPYSLRCASASGRA
jgi:hypothetical protein